MTQPHEPISWLRLERYALGELSVRERREIEARLSESPADRECLAQIVSDRSDLPELPLVLPTRRVAPRQKVAMVLGALAAAASLTFALLRAEPTGSERSSEVKGGHIALLLQGEHGGEQPQAFSQGERFKVLVTCPPGFSQPLVLLVFQGGERYAPLGAPRRLTCGNLVPWPGAFALDGRDPVTVCVTSANAQDAASSAGELGSDAVCRTLVPR